MYTVIGKLKEIVEYLLRVYLMVIECEPTRLGVDVVNVNTGVLALLTTET
jgi:hypothetical protein